MLVPISKTFFTGTVFLAFYTAVASASPAAVSPNDTGLIRRAPPVNNMCGEMQWLWRECWPKGGEMAYRDMCWSHNLNQDLPVRSNCPENHECVPVIDVDKDKSIDCVPIPKSGRVDVKTDSGGQAGSSPVKQGVITPSMTMSHQAIIHEDIYGSVSAALLSEKDDMILSPASIIVGKIHGKDYTVCKGNSADEIKSFECYPTGLFDLNEGDQIDFTWAMKNAQRGSLKYVFSPAGAKR